MSLTEFLSNLDKKHIMILILFVAVVVLLYLNYRKVSKISAQNEPYVDIQSYPQNAEIPEDYQNPTCQDQGEISLTEEFDPKTQAPKDTLVLYHVGWCGHCKNFKPHWNEFAKKYRNRVNIMDIDCDDKKNQQKCGLVNGFPTVLLLKDGQEKPIPFDMCPRTRQFYPRTVKGLQKFLDDNHV